MDLTSEIFTTVLSPLAASAVTAPSSGSHDNNNRTQTTNLAKSESEGDALSSWQTSPLNPQSRLDSLAPLSLPLPLPLPLPSPFPTSTSTPTSTPTTTSIIAPPASTTAATSTPTQQQQQPNPHPHPPRRPQNETKAAVTWWRIDGVSPTGRRFFAAPSFALGAPPLRVDVCLPPAQAFPAALRAVVRPERAVVYATTTTRTTTTMTAGAAGAGAAAGQGQGVTVVGGLEVGAWLGRVLTRWGGAGSGLAGTGSGVGDGKEGWLERVWWGLPFGSRIHIALPPDEDGGGGIGLTAAAAAGEVEVQVVPEYSVEQGMVGVEGLRSMWEGEVPQEAWDAVEVVAWERLGLRRQVHEAISLVTVDGDGPEVVVFKCLLQEQRYLYNELKMLLALRPHPNVMPRPLGIVTKKARFGNRRGVCGFLLEWFPLGSLRERLVRDDYDTATPMAQRFRWARQVVEAFAHINSHERAGFYPDLKPDNVLLRKNNRTGLLDAVLIDLEQRGGWFAWSPPEVAYLEYLEILAGDSGLPEGKLQLEITSQLRDYYGDPAWSPETCGRKVYGNAEGGFSAPWLALLRSRHAGGAKRDALERAQVFMIGKLLWCIFEGQALVRCGIDHEVLRDADPRYETARSGKVLAFPEFKRTPAELRRLIHACTAGAPEWETDHDKQRLPGVVLRGGKLYPASLGPDISDATAADTLEAAREFWCREAEQARAFMRDLLRHRRQPAMGSSSVLPCGDGLLGRIAMRPRFAEVLAELQRIERLL